MIEIELWNHLCLVFFNKKSTLTLNLLEFRCKLNWLRMQQDSWNRLEWFPRTERETKCSNVLQQWEEASENIRKQSVSLLRRPLMWLESTSNHHGYRKLVKDVFFFSKDLRRGAQDQAELQTTQCLIGCLLGWLISRLFRSLPSFFSVISNSLLMKWWWFMTFVVC